MVEITKEMLRKRAEHNEGMLSTLEEVSLHQQDIKEITGLDQFCRHLKIIYLQSNLIEKMSGLSKLKELEYLNLAVNSVKTIEGIRRCESLNKLDMTLNFIDVEDIEQSVDEMEYCERLEDLYLTGNPVTEWPGYKDYILGRLPQIMRLDGEDIYRSERIKARARLPELETELAKLAEETIKKKEYMAKEGIVPEGYKREDRWNMYVEDQKRKEEDEKKGKENSMFKDYNSMVEEAKNVSSEIFD